MAVVNARISDRSWPRYRALRGFGEPFLSRLSRVLAQSADRRRTAPRHRLPAGPGHRRRQSQVRRARSPGSEATRLLQALAHGLRLVVAGSTLEGEEAALLDVWPQLLAVDPNLALVLAPRHPERFAAVAALLQQSGLAWNRRSDWRGASQRAPSSRCRPGQVVLLDTIGELASVYSLAAVAFVGGSLVPAGGHNPLEPAQFGVPIVMGPYYANFRAITEDLRAHDALRIAKPEDLAGTLLRFAQ